MDIEYQETKKLPVPPPRSQSVLSGYVMLQPLQDGCALAQINLNRAVDATITIPADIVRQFVAEYIKQQAARSKLEHTSRKFK